MKKEDPITTTVAANVALVPELLTESLQLRF